MEPGKFIQPKEIEIEGTKYLISKIPAIRAQQVYRGIMQASATDGDIALTYLPEDVALGLLEFVAVVEGDEKTALDSADKVNFYIPQVEELIKLEAAMIRYNFGFLFDGSLQKVLEALREGREI